MSGKKKIQLGDVVESITKATGIEKIVKFVAGEDCGCKERKEKLNNLFSRRFKSRCLNEQEYISWGNFQNERSLRLSKEQVTYVCNLYASVFNKPVWYPCSSCSVKPLINMIERLDLVYSTYEN